VNGPMVPPTKGLAKDDPLNGQLVGGKYRVVRPLGAGGMGTVYLAKHEESGFDVVVKVMRPGLARELVSLERFKREARALEHVTHPNVVQVLGFGPHDETYFLAMEYVKGYDLSTLLKHKGALDLSLAIMVGTQLLAALQAIHDKGIIHRDLKPGNIRITSSADDPLRVKVIDFGLVKSHSEAVGNEPLTQVGRVVGTPAYMSPEQVVGGSVDGRSDLYSVGVILYQMLTGTHPFTAKTPTGFMRQHYHDQPDDVTSRAAERGIHPELEAFVMRLLAKDRENRPCSAANALAELQRLEKLVSRESAEEETVSGEVVADVVERPGPAPKEQVPTPAKSRSFSWLWWTLAGLAGLGALVAVLIWAFPPSK